MVGKLPNSIKSKMEMTMENKLSEFEDRIVAYIDLQGFTNEVNEIGFDYDKFMRVKKILETMKKLEDKKEKNKLFGSLPDISDSDKEILENGFECIVVSDSIIVSYPAIPIAFNLLSIELALMQWEILWKWNYLIRGFISRGKCFHKNGVIFGDGYLKAYLGAEKNTNHSLPYILIQDLLVTNSGSIVDIKTDLYIKDHLDRYFINYGRFIDNSPTRKNLNASADQQAMRAMQFLHKCLELFEKDKKIWEKYYWTFKYCCSVSSLIDQFKDKNL